MSTKVKIQLAIILLFGFLFLGLGIYQWYDLNLIEQGKKDGSLSIVLHHVYQMAGKWGVALVYMPFAIYCFWRAYILFKIHRGEEKYQMYDNDNEENQE